MCLITEFMKQQVEAELKKQKLKETELLAQVKREEQEKQLERLEHVKRKLEQQRKKSEERQDSNSSEIKLHWQALIRCEFIVNIVESAEIQDLVEKLCDVDLGFKLVVKSVTRVKSEAETLARYHHHKDSLSNPNRTVRKFYGNTKEIISETIIRSGFSLSSHLTGNEGRLGSFGCGCYFTTNSNVGALHCGEVNSGHLLYCEVALGTFLATKKEINGLTAGELNEKGYESVYAGREFVSVDTGIEYEQFVIYHPFQAIPLYLIMFEKVAC
eukprot:TRINITY_DN9111_c0_g1_i5.p1 TRINITY_DN9111_c0_g1~~TRINITY_DN9111_c0_g1_i5.p1  ORF type:complete len:271 (-),score=50.90 TRINITY_DN9111_c0_g1_i5:227-1039(-)